jgi:Glyoxalase/Bleomycin resistance protein/Dioxygenase superfamily
MIEGFHFQNAYVCDDIEEGIALLKARGHDRPVQIIDVNQPIKARTRHVVIKSRICFIWAENLQYELIQVLEDPIGIYANCVSNGGPLRFHHTCMRIAEWHAFRARVDHQDLPLALERDGNDDALKFLYLDGRKVFGHYLEYTWMTDQRWNQIRAM